MTELTPDEKKRVSEAWKKFALETIDLDNKRNDTKPHGHHWFCGLALLRDKNPNFSFRNMEKFLSEEHLFKKATANNLANTEEALKTKVTELETVLGNQEKIDTIYFSRLNFNTKIDFSNFIFPIDTDFSNTTFLKDALFTNAIFLETANFENTKFHRKPETYRETAKFKDAVFMKTADFSKAVFGAYANFKGATFSARTIFQQAEFKYHAPRFYGTTFNNEIILNRIELPTAKRDKLHKIIKDERNKNDTGNDILQKTVEENKSAYETLIYLMEKQNKHHDQHRFFREEMRWRQVGNILTRERRKVEEVNWRTIKLRERWRTIPKKFYTAQLRKLYMTILREWRMERLQKWRGTDSHKYINREYFLWQRLEHIFTINFFWLYENITDYGYDIGRAFAWWLGHILAGMLPIFFMTFCASCLEWKEMLFCTTSVSFANANPYVFAVVNDGELMECYKELNKSWPIFFGSIRGIQTVIGIILLFLLLTTLRVRFRLK